MVKIKLGAICTFIGGGTPDRTVPEYWGGSIPWVSVKDFKSNRIDSAQESITELGLSKSASNLIKAGTIIIPTRMALGKVAVCTTDVTINQDLKAISIIDESIVYRDYLVSVLLSKASYIESRGKGATVKGITLDVLRDLEIPLPPIPEQQRIVEQLDQAQKLIDHRKEQLKLMDDLIQSTFYDMFGDPVKNEKGWEVKPLGELISQKPQNGMYKPSTEYVSAPNGVPILRIDSFYSGKITKRNFKRLNCDSSDLSRYGLAVNDIVINRVNSLEYLGKCALIDRLDEPTVYESNMMRFRVDETVLNPFFTTSLLSHDFTYQQVMGRAKKAVNQASINQTDVITLNFLCPPLDLQTAFADRVQQIESLKSQMATSLTDLEQNFNALMQQSFGG